MARRHGRTTTWDTVVRALAKTGHETALKVDADGQLASNPAQRTCLHENLAQGIATLRYLDFAAHTRETEADVARGRDIGMLSQTKVHEGMRGVLALAAIAWRELGGVPAEEPLAALIDMPCDDPLVAIRVPERMSAVFADDQPTIGPLGREDHRIWYVEIESQSTELPNAIVEWTTGDSPANMRIHTAAIWTEGRNASPTRPLVHCSQRAAETTKFTVGAMRLFDGTEGEWRKDDESEAAEGRHETVQRTAVARIAHHAIEAWLQAEARGRATPGGFDTRAGHRTVGKGATKAKERAREWRDAAKWLRRRGVLEAPACPAPIRERARTLPRDPDTGLDAVLLAAARTTDTTAGGPNSVELWSDDWWQRAEQGLLQWQMTTPMAPPGRVINDRFMELSGEIEDILQRPSARAVRCMNELGWKILTATKRSAVIHSGAKGTVYGLKIPPRLWRAVAEAGAHPAPIDLLADDAWWYVEIEEPTDGEPRGVGLWVHRDPDGTPTDTGVAIWTAPAPASPTAPFIVGWRIARETGRLQGSWALAHEDGRPPLAPGIAKYKEYHRDPAAEAMAERCMAMITGTSNSVLDRVEAAISEHLTRGTSTPLSLDPGPLREANRARWDPTNPEPRPDERASVFRLVRAPDPMRTDEADDGKPGGKRTDADGARGTLQERQYVSAHWKRQAHGPAGRLRRTIIIEGYWRGPEPDDEHIALTRMADRGANKNTTR